VRITKNIFRILKYVTCMRSVGTKKKKVHYYVYTSPVYAIQSQPCNVSQCNVTGRWTSWYPWDSCSSSCGKGITTRYRHCFGWAASHQQLVCSGANSQIKDCNGTICIGEFMLLLKSFESEFMVFYPD
jgi:hypothetical protein